MNLYIDGCSYSSYYWATWADILCESNPDSYNVAESGSGNERIFFNLMHNLPKFTPGSTKVVLQWSGYPRFDHWDTRRLLKWHAAGNRYFVGDFVEKNSQWWSDEWLKFKSYYYVKAAAQILEKANIEYYFMTMDDWAINQDKAAAYLGINWQSIILDPKMIMYNMNDFIANDLKYSYSADWTQGKCEDGHPSITSHIRIAEHINRHLNMNIDKNVIQDYRKWELEVKQAETVEQVHEIGKPYKHNDRYLKIRSLMPNLCNA